MINPEKLVMGMVQISIHVPELSRIRRFSKRQSPNEEIENTMSISYSGISKSVSAIKKQI